jgi:hypothetical protein
MLNRPAAATEPVPGKHASATTDVVRRARAVPFRGTRLGLGGMSVLLVLVFAARSMSGDFSITLVDF